MILADTSVWVDHFTAGGHRISGLLAQNQLLMHPFVRGELSMGNLSDRSETLSWLDSLPRCDFAGLDDVSHLVEVQRLHGRGIGFVDATLLASVLITPGARLWTRDKRLDQAAEQLGVSA